MAAWQIVPAFEVLDAPNLKVLDGWHAIAYYWVGKNPAAALFAGPPGGPFGMDHMDYLGWLYVGGGLEMWRDFYQNDLKLNVIPFPAHPSSPQALGWFKKPLKSVADFKGMKCRQTGLNAEVYAKLGQSVVNMPGGEIVPAAQRGVIDCAEWVGGVEDLRLGLPQVFKYHYTPGMHENNSIGELGFNLDVWKSFTPQQQEAANSAVKDTFITWITRWQKQNADAMEEMVQKHGARILRTPPDILLASLKAWDEVAKENSDKSPTFKKVYESQREYAAKVVPAKRYMFPPYSFSANETDTGLKLFGGYRFHPNFSVEGGYAELGEFSASGTVTTFNFAPIVPLPTKVTIKVGQGLHLAVVGNLPLAGGFSVFGRLGGYNLRTEMKVTVSSLTASESARNSGFLLGAGLGYEFDRNVGIRLEWEQFDKVGDKDKTGQGDVGLLSVGLVYRF